MNIARLEGKGPLLMLKLQITLCRELEKRLLRGVAEQRQRENHANTIGIVTMGVLLD